MDIGLLIFLLTSTALGWLLFAVELQRARSEANRRLIAEANLEQYIEYAERLKADLDRILDTVVIMDTPQPKPSNPKRS